MGEVIDLRGSRNLACECGSEWFDAAVVIEERTSLIVGWSAKVRCRECGRERTLTGPGAG